MDVLVLIFGGLPRRFGAALSTFALGGRPRRLGALDVFPEFAFADLGGRPLRFEECLEVLFDEPALADFGGLPRRFGA